MHRWLRIGLITIVTILPISMVVILVRRFFSQSDSSHQVIQSSRRPSSRELNATAQVIHNYSPSSVEIPIDQRNIGFIIGRGGEKIKRIQAEADVRIRFRDHGGMPHSSESSANNLDGAAIISGRPECIQLAKNMIEKILQERVRDEQPMEVRLKIPDWICGRVIGHRGQNIKNLQASSGARITIENPPNNVAPSELRNCILTGSPDQIRIANELIEAVLERETNARAQRVASKSFYGKPRSVSTSGYLSSPTLDRDSATSRLHYSTNTDLRGTGANPAQTSPFKFPNLISTEERVYLMYFSEQVQSHLQPLPLDQEFFTAYVSTVDRNALVWIQLLDGIGMELQNLIDKMTSVYTNIVENGVEIDTTLRTDNLPPFEHESEGITESTAVEERRKFFSEPTSSPESVETEPTQVHTRDSHLESENSADSDTESPFGNSACDIANTPNESATNSSTFQPGMLVAAPYTDDDKYYRAAIERVETSEGRAYVYFVDFGDYDVCELSLLRLLKEEFKSFPFQAILCQLNDVEIDPSGLSEYAFTRLQELTFCSQWRRICVLPSKTGQSFHKNMTCIRNCPTVTLIDTNGASDVNVNQSLIQEQLVTRAEYQHTFT